MASESEFLDWRAPDWEWDRGLTVGILVVGGGEVFEEEEYLGDDIPNQIASDLLELTEADRAYVGHIDPTVGAGTNGLGFLLQFLDLGASIITWGVAITMIEPKLRRAIEHLRQRFEEEGTTVRISLTAEALQVLATADVCARNGIDPADVKHVRCISHEIDPSERRIELKQLYSAHTIAVEAVGDDYHHHAWVYTVTPWGKVLFEWEVRVPIPNASHWDFLEVTPGRLLHGL